MLLKPKTYYGPMFNPKYHVEPTSVIIHSNKAFIMKKQKQTYKQTKKKKTHTHKKQNKTKAKHIEIVECN